MLGLHAVGTVVRRGRERVYRETSSRCGTARRERRVKSDENVTVRKLFECRTPPLLGVNRPPSTTHMNHPRLATLSLLLLATASLAVQASAQLLTITEWNFNSGSNVIGVNTSPAASTGTGTASTLGMTSDYNGTASTDTSDINTSTPLSSDPGITNQQWRIRGGDGTASPGTGNNAWSSNAPIGTQGAQFTGSTAGFTNIQVSFDWSPTGQGEAKLQLQYTLNGSTYFNVPASLFTATGGATATTNSTSANTVTGGFLLSTTTANYMNGIVANLSSITGAANDPDFGIRMVNAATGADCTNTAGAAINNTSGNWRFDEVTISGSVSAAPEPSTFIMAGLGLGGLLMLARRRKAA